MTEQEYLHKRSAYATSSAPQEVIEKAIKELDELFSKQQDATIQVEPESGDID